MPMSLNQFIQAVDNAIRRKTGGVSLFDLPDEIDLAELWESEYAVTEVANIVLGNAGWKG